MRNKRQSKYHHLGATWWVGVLGMLVLWPALPATGAIPAHSEGVSEGVKVAIRPPPRPATDTPSPGRDIVVARKATRIQGEDISGCRRLPGSRGIVRLNLKPETDVTDLVAWISSITCRQFLVPGTVFASTKKVTVYAPQLITAEEAYQLFLTALDSVGLTVQESGKFLRIIETSKVKTTAVPLFGFTGERLSRDEN